MEELKQSIIERIGMIEDKFDKRMYIGEEVEKIMQLSDTGIYTDEELDDFNNFISQQKQLLYI